MSRTYTNKARRFGRLGRAAAAAALTATTALALAGTAHAGTYSGAYVSPAGTTASRSDGSTAMKRCES